MIRCTRWWLAALLAAGPVVATHGEDKRPIVSERPPLRTIPGASDAQTSLPPHLGADEIPIGNGTSEELRASHDRSLRHNAVSPGGRLEAPPPTTAKKPEEIMANAKPSASTISFFKLDKLFESGMPGRESTIETLRPPLRALTYNSDLHEARPHSRLDMLLETTGPPQHDAADPGLEIGPKSAPLRHEMPGNRSEALPTARPPLADSIETPRPPLRVPGSEASVPPQLGPLQVHVRVDEHTGTDTAVVSLGISNPGATTASPPTVRLTLPEGTHFGQILLAPPGATAAIVDNEEPKANEEANKGECVEISLTTRIPANYTTRLLTSVTPGANLTSKNVKAEIVPGVARGGASQSGLPIAPR